MSLNRTPGVVFGVDALQEPLPLKRDFQALWHSSPRAGHTLPGGLEASGTLINGMVKLIGISETVVDNKSTHWRISSPPTESAVFSECVT